MPRTANSPAVQELSGFVSTSAPVALLDVLRRKAQDLALKHVHDGGALHLSLTDADARFQLAEEGLDIALTGDSENRIFQLQQVLLWVLAQHDPSVVPVWDRQPVSAYPPNLIFAQVESLQRLSPGFCRLALRSTDLARFGADALHFRLLLPPRGRKPVFPTLDVHGRILWPEGADALHRPVYTFRTLDNRAGRAEVDIFLHEGGRVTEWTAQAQPGETLGLMGPAGKALGTPGWVALLGDETAMPAIARHLAVLPRQTLGEAFILCEPDDRQALTHPPGLRLTWLSRASGQTLCAALSDLMLPSRDDRLVWVAAEKSEADRARVLLHDLRGIPRQQTHVTAYWHADRG